MTEKVDVPVMNGGEVKLGTNPRPRWFESIKCSMLGANPSPGYRNGDFLIPEASIPVAISSGCITFSFYSLFYVYGFASCPAKHGVTYRTEVGGRRRASVVGFSVIFLTQRRIAMTLLSDGFNSHLWLSEGGVPHVVRRGEDICGGI